MLKTIARLAAIGCGLSLFAAVPAIATQVDGTGTVIRGQQGATPLVLSEDTDFLLENVRINGLVDQAALTLSGPIRSILIRNSQFGQIIAGSSGRAAAMQAIGASVRSLVVADSAFYDADNQLISLKEGSFGVVTFTHCTFKTSEACLKRLYAESPWRTTPPLVEFSNIDRLELFDNEFENTTIIIHPSVKTVIFRGDISHVQVESPETHVMHLDLNQALPSDYASAAPPAQTVRHGSSGAIMHPPEAVAALVENFNDLFLVGDWRNR